MKKRRIACLHAHYSNIEYIENALSEYSIELVHFVDPGLIHRVTNDQNFHQYQAQQKVKEQIEWIAQCGVDAILITCTNYIALLEENPTNLPIIKIDEPYFEIICSINKPQTMVFSNPETVKGTMNRLYQYAETHNRTIDIEVAIIENSFSLLMQGKKDEYQKEIVKFLKQLPTDRIISVAQLSMVAAARQVEGETGKVIIHPLNSLVGEVKKRILE